MIFYLANILPGENILSEEESLHCVKVLRLKNRDVVNLIDGNGTFAQASIVEAHAKKCVVNVVEINVNFNKRSNSFNLVFAPTKNNERTEWLLEKATEIGIDTFIPIITQRSERVNLNVDRLNKVLLSAIKQSQKAYLPKLLAPVKYTDYIAAINYDQKMIAHCLDTSTKENIIDVFEKNKNTTILIGPEGDFTLAEIELAVKNNFKEVSISTSRLRTETAALHACSIFNALNKL